MKTEYEAWLDSIPESLQGGQQADCIGETVEELGSVLDILEEIRLPRGFGRD